MSVCIFSTVNQIEAGLLENALKDKGIENYAKNKHSNSIGLGGLTVPFAGTNLVTGNIEIYVNEEDVEKAIEIVKVLFDNANGNEDNPEIVEMQSSTNASENEKEDETIIDDNDIKKKKLSSRKKILIFFTSIFLALLIFAILAIISSQPKKNNTFNQPSKPIQSNNSLNNTNNLVTDNELKLPPKIDITRYITKNISVQYPNIPSHGTKSDVRIWGWSKTGKIAFSEEYIHPKTEKVDAHIKMIEYYILDLIKDEIVFKCNWNSNNGISYSDKPQPLFFDMSEKGIQKLFNIQKEAISNANISQAIVYNQVDFFPFPFKDNNFIYNCNADIEFIIVNMDLAGFEPDIVKTIKYYDIIVSRSDSKRKIINSDTLYTGDLHHYPNIHICGYLKSPYENRIVVISALERKGLEEGLELNFNGCNLDSGFNN